MNFNELTEKEMLNINGGGRGISLGDAISWAEPAWDFVKGVGKGFVETAKSFDD
jgi:bacteriocin-like protein